MGVRHSVSYYKSPDGQLEWLNKAKEETLRAVTRYLLVLGVTVNHNLIFTSDGNAWPQICKT